MHNNSLFQAHDFRREFNCAWWDEWDEAGDLLLWSAEQAEQERQRAEQAEILLEQERQQAEQTRR